MKNIKKWIQGIAASVVASLVVWFVINDRPSPLAGPKVELADVDVPERIAAGEEFVVSFRATNQRDKAQPGCNGFAEITPPEKNGAGDSNAGDDTSQAQDGSTALDAINRPAIRDPAAGVDSRISGVGDSVSEVIENSGSDVAEPAAEVDVAEVIQTHRLPQKPVVPDAVTVPIQPSLFAARHSACNTINPEFSLRGVSGSAEHVMVDCVVRRPGVFQISYGIHCAKEEGSMWRLDHRGYLKVEES